MEKIVIFSDEFHQSIEDLIVILFIKEYFGFEDSCQNYADKIYDFVEENIEQPTIKETPIFHKRFGKFYLKYKANNRTTWYIFFDRKENRFLVNHIFNNHSQDFPELI